MICQILMHTKGLNLASKSINYLQIRTLFRNYKNLQLYVSKNNLNEMFIKRAYAFKHITWCRLVTMKQFYSQQMVYNNYKETDKHNLKDYENDLGKTSSIMKNILLKTYKNNKHINHIKNHNTNLSIKDVMDLHLAPKNIVHNFYNIVSNELDIHNGYHVTYSNDNHNVWHCTYKLTWPDEQTFEATGNNKQIASKIAAYKCLHWLYTIGKINSNGYPILYNIKQVEQPQQMEIHKNIIHALKSIVNDYEKDFKEIIQYELNQNDESDLVKNNKETMVSYLNVNPIRRNEQLFNRLMFREDLKEKNLPIIKFKDEILTNLETNQVIVIQGDTGCGKTTQVPQIIMDHFIKNSMAASCNIIVTEPRRISAVTVAERVALERKENIGDVVGYQVRFAKKLPKYPGSILFCTTGVFRNKIQSCPDLKGFSHIILDEAHERTVDTDILMVMIKRALKLNSSLKVIIMSATINAELFQRYFNGPLITVPGTLYPVKMHFLEDVMKYEICSSKIEKNNKLIPNENISINLQLMANVIKFITLNKPPGAILSFLPGWESIEKLKNILITELKPKTIQIFPLHSKLPNNIQKMIYSTTPEGVRKIILATDIAETGITVPDVVYVVDCATHKLFLWNDEKCIFNMLNSLVSKANIEQRKGRAGRVQPGESYHLISRDVYKNLQLYPIPEIQRTSLEKIVLDCKFYGQDNVEQFLNELPEPPTTLAIRNAIFDLKKIGALDFMEKLTHLGKRIAPLNEHPTVAKTLILARIFCCLDPVLTISADFSMNSNIFLNNLNNRSNIREIKRNFQPFSDHIAYAWIFKQSQMLMQTDPSEDFLINLKRKICPDKAINLAKLRFFIFKQLHECGMVESDIEYNDLSSNVNTYSNLDELVRGLLLAGTDKLLFHKEFSLQNGVVKRNQDLYITEKGSRGFLSPDTVNYKRREWPSPYLTYFSNNYSPEMRGELIRESSLVSPLSVLLFASGKIQISEDLNDNSNNKVVLRILGKPNVKISCDHETASSILKFRRVMWEIVKYFYKMQIPGSPEPNSDLAKIEAFKSKMLTVIARALTEASVDNFTNTNNKKVDNVIS